MHNTHTQKHTQVLASPLLRALHTAAPIGAAFGAPVHLCPTLAESAAAMQVHGGISVDGDGELRVKSSAERLMLRAELAKVAAQCGAVIVQDEGYPRDVGRE
jgi:broad specificity phosphatase PhoE